MNTTRFRILRIEAFAGILLTMSVAWSTAACAPAARNWSSSPQITRPGRDAGVVPGNWQGVESLRLATPLVVTLKRGERLSGSFKALSPEALVLTDRVGKELTVPRPEISRIVVQARDGITNGALIGAGIGLGAALAVLAAVGSREGYVLPSAKWGAPLLLSGLGSLSGILVDRAHKSQKLIYLAGHDTIAR